MKSFNTPPADILVVDDHPHNLELLRTVLEAEGHHVHVELDGPSALRVIDRMPFDIALVDVRMPDMSGYELCERLKANPRTRNMPIIFLSALDDATDKVQAFDSGGDDYIVKPFKVAEVLARVGNQLRNATVHRQVHAKNEELRRRNAELSRQSAPDLLSPHTPGGSPLSLLSPVESTELFDGKYKLHEQIGHGGFGEVYRATHVILDRPVAIKVLRSEKPVTSQDAVRFRLEGMSACRVDHPNAVAMWDAGVTPQGAVYLVMELLTGRSLRAELLERGRLSIGRTLWITRAVCDVLTTAHAAGVIHRDVKPDNVFLHLPREGAEVVKVVDFGIAKLVGSPVDNGSNTSQGLMIGTPEYLSPERLLTRPYDGRSDIYSLGCMTYEMLTGRVPFVGNKEAPWMVATQHVGQIPPPIRDINPKVPNEIGLIVHGMLEKNPSQRPFAAEVLSLIDKVIELYPMSSVRGHRHSAPAIVRVNTEAPTLPRPEDESSEMPGGKRAG